MNRRFVLGVNRVRGEAVELDMPRDVSQHVTLIGVTGSGKTTTAAVLARAALAGQIAVVIVDAKGGGLRTVARALAAEQNVPYREVLPGAPTSVGYDPCALGSAGQIADKLVAAFTHGPNAEIYRLIAQEALAVLTSALQALGERVTVRRLRAELDHKRLDVIAQRVGAVSPAVEAELDELAGRGRLTADALEGMRARLGALLRGVYGELFDDDRPALRLERSITESGMTYIGLPALAATNDTTLMARVLIQDLKQVAHLQLLASAPPPALLILDEFAALDDPVQLCDLLRQAREARIATVVSTQHLPDEQSAHALRSSLLGAGLLITHRAGHADAEAAAAAIGTERAVEVTRQVSAGVDSGVGSIRKVERYVVNPNVIKQLDAGDAVVLAQVTGRRVATVHVVPTE